MELENIVKAAAGRSDNAVFNNAAQALNHEIFWNSLSPAKENAPSDALRESLQRDFGGNDKFRHAFRQAALGLFGSGWVWLVSDAGTLRIVTTGNAGCPIVDNLDPLLTLDVWEHAYYLDVQNDRATYVDRFLDQLLNWQHASEAFRGLDKAA
jgi:Fe-Mn family superoxide dismutase